jgi:hypothetical protein
MRVHNVGKLYYFPEFARVKGCEQHNIFARPVRVFFGGGDTCGPYGVTHTRARVIINIIILILKLPVLYFTVRSYTTLLSELFDYYLNLRFPYVETTTQTLRLNIISYCAYNNRCPRALCVSGVPKRRTYDNTQRVHLITYIYKYK